IRGGIFNLQVGNNGQVTANFLYGVSFTVTSGGVTQTTTQQGQQTVIAPGAPPPAFAPIPPGGLQTTVASFEGPSVNNGNNGGNNGSPGGNGGQGGQGGNGNVGGGNVPGGRS